MVAECKHSHKMRLLTEAIKLILDTVKEIDEKFNPNDMPGISEDFYKFCLYLIPSENLA